MDYNKKLISELLQKTSSDEEKKEIILEYIKTENNKKIADTVLQMIGTISAAMVFGYIMRTLIITKM